MCMLHIRLHCSVYGESASDAGGWNSADVYFAFFLHIFTVTHAPSVFHNTIPFGDDHLCIFRDTRKNIYSLYVSPFWPLVSSDMPCGYATNAFPDFLTGLLSWFSSLAIGPSSASIHFLHCMESWRFTRHLFLLAMIALSASALNDDDVNYNNNHNACWSWWVPQLPSDFLFKRWKCAQYQYTLFMHAKIRWVYKYSFPFGFLNFSKSSCENWHFWLSVDDHRSRSPFCKCVLTMLAAILKYVLLDLSLWINAFHMHPEGWILASWPESSPHQAYFMWGILYHMSWWYLMSHPFKWILHY